MDQQTIKAKSEGEAQEMLDAAKINFMNFEKANPQVNENPIYKLAKLQLDAARNYYLYLHDDSDGD